jgi:hypothetical protein
VKGPGRITKTHFRQVIQGFFLLFIPTLFQRFKGERPLHRLPRDPMLPLRYLATQSVQRLARWLPQIGFTEAFYLDVDGMDLVSILGS